MPVYYALIFFLQFTLASTSSETFTQLLRGLLLSVFHQIWVDTIIWCYLDVRLRSRKSIWCYLSLNSALQHPLLCIFSFTCACVCLIIRTPNELHKQKKGGLTLCLKFRRFYISYNVSFLISLKFRLLMIFFIFLRNTK